MKPLNKKNYGSIPHLLGSKIGETDKYIHERQHRIMTEKLRDKHDLLFVTEKYDGSNVGITKVDGKIHAITRAGYLAETSPYKQHHYFAKWVELQKDRFNFIGEKGRLTGEWLLQAHGTKYEILTEPFVAFDYFLPDNERLNYKDLWWILEQKSVQMVRVIFHGKQALPIKKGMKTLNNPDPRFPTDKPEGLVYRIERKGKFDFAAKYVRPNYESGKYIIGIPDEQAIYNMPPEKLFEILNDYIGTKQYAETAEGKRYRVR